MTSSLKGCSKFLQLLGSPLKDDRVVVQRENPVGDEKDVGDLVADQDGGEPEFPLVFGDHAQDRVLPDRVLPGRGFVKENDPGVGHQSPGQGHPFLHAAGQFRGVLADRVRRVPSA